MFSSEEKRDRLKDSFQNKKKSHEASSDGHG
jgi:hypothetical protein